MSSSRYDDFINLRSVIVRAVSLTWKKNNKGFEERFLKNPLLAMEQEFNYLCPFEIDFKAKRSGPGNPHFYDAKTTGGWVGTNNGVGLCLPPAPPKEERAEALAAYNQQFIFFLREKDDGPKDTAGVTSGGRK
jgi:ribosomally synthesized peptide (two-chain TOMM family)